MASIPFRKFERHAYLYLRATRHTWSEKERMITIETAYYSNPAVRHHYATHGIEFPRLSLLFPRRPYTEYDHILARSHGQLAAQLGVGQVPNIVPLGYPPREHAPREHTPRRMSEPVRPSAPYSHWPPPPWSPEPDIPDVGVRVLTLEAKERFINTRPHMSEEDETDWQGAKFLGCGSSGAVGLWCRIDEHGNVVDRMIVKDNAAVPRDVWRDPKNWRDRLPREIAIGRRIETRRENERDACQYINRYRGHRLLMSKRRFRLYADFATGGAMDSTILKYHLGWQNIVDERISLQETIPEAFIWYVIRALATALIILQHGTLGDEAVTDWKPIMHLDIQPANILLDVQNRKRRRSEDDASGSVFEGPSKRRKADREVIPQLADFGLSFFDLDFSHGPELDENPQDHILPKSEFNTRYAPEHQIFVDENSQRLDEKTDVWGIERIAWTLIVNKLNNDGPVREGGPLTEGRPLPLSQIHDANMQFVRDHYDEEVLVGSDAWPAARRYSEELKSLVRDCLKYFKENRPSPKDVLRRVDRHLDANPGLREEMADPHGTLLDFPDDGAFEIGELLIAHRPSG